MIRRRWPAGTVEVYISAAQENPAATADRLAAEPDGRLVPATADTGPSLPPPAAPGCSVGHVVADTAGITSVRPAENI